MSIHKKRPKLNTYFKAKVLLKNKVKKLKIFSPVINHLTSKFATILQKYFQERLKNRKKAKLIFGLYRTSLLKKYQQHRLLKSCTSRHLFKEVEFCSLLERRLDFILLRTGFVSTLYEAKHLISHKKVRVNNTYSACFSRLLKKGDIISFDLSIEDRLRKQLIKQSKIRSFFFTTFTNLEVNFKTLKIILLMDKINLKKQIHHYSHTLNWKTLIKE